MVLCTYLPTDTKLYCTVFQMIHLQVSIFYRDDNCLPNQDLR